jgi:hypothetical protein
VVPDAFGISAKVQEKGKKEKRREDTMRNSKDFFIKKILYE